MKAVALAVLAGFLATVAPAAGAAPLDCCGNECPACAPVFCKETRTFTAVKAPPLAALPSISAVAGRVSDSDGTEPMRAARPLAGSPGFQRPMRN